MKKTLSLLLTFSISSFSVSALDGAGSQNDPFQIGSAEELYEFTELVKKDINACAVLTDDITINEIELDSVGNPTKDDYKEWIPIGNDSIAYNGTFDGANHVIRGIYLINTKIDYIGLFSHLDSLGVIENLTIKDSYIKGGKFNGFICGHNEGTIKNCQNYGKIAYAKDYSGGIVGLNEKDVLSCVNYGQITAEGGICGMNKGTISECTNYGNVSTGNYFAGICGTQKEGTISKCLNYGPIGFKSNSCTYIAGICGEMDNGSIINCLNAGIINKKNSYIAGICAKQKGGIISSCLSNQTDSIVYSGNKNIVNSIYLGYSYTNKNDQTYTITDFQMKNGLACLLLNGGKSDDSTVWGQTIGVDTLPILGGKRVYPASSSCIGRISNEPGEDLSHESNVYVCRYCCHSIDTFKIYTTDDLYEFADVVKNQGTNVYAKLMNDIVVNEGAVSNDENGQLKWTPIAVYSGTFDGQGFSISGLYITGTGSYIGLFSDNSGEIKNLGVSNSTCDCGTYRGVICGINHGSISLCHAELTTEMKYCSNSTGGTGTICGINDGGEINNCYSFGGSYLCGIHKNGTVSNCFANSYMSSYSSKGSFINCYSIFNDVYDRDEHLIEMAKNGELCYLLQGNQEEQVWGQRIGKDTYPKFSNDIVYSGKKCPKYFTNDTLNINEDHLFKKCVCIRCNYTGPEIHEYDNCYCVNCGVKDSTCDTHIHKLDYGYCVCGYRDTTASFCFDISTVDDLYEFVDHINKGNVYLNARLMNDIMVNDVDWSLYNETSDYDLIKTIKVWTGIDYNMTYQGNFDGQGHVINGLYFISTTGFIANAKNAVFRNIGIENCRAIINEKSPAGILCGTADSCSFTNCYVTGHLESDNSSAAGLVGGAIDCAFEHCYNLAVIKGYSAVAGITCGGESGYNRKSVLKFDNCWNAGLISSTDTYCTLALSGIASSYWGGHHKTTLNNCYNIGHILCIGVCDDENAPGGLVAGPLQCKAFLFNCYNLGEVTGGKNICFADIFGGNPYNMYPMRNYDFSKEENDGFCLHNCYYLDKCMGDYWNDSCTSYLNRDLDIHAMTAEQFANGEVCYKLNKGVTDGTQPYYQNLNVIRDSSSLRSSDITIDAYPVVEKTHRTVYNDGDEYFNYGTLTGSKGSSADNLEPVFYTKDRTIYVGNVVGRIMLSDVNGRSFYSKKVQNPGTSNFIEIPIQQSGSYLLVINGKAYKVMVK